MAVMTPLVVVQLQAISVPEPCFLLTR